MSPREPAETKLGRVLQILPEAAREGGVSIDELARALGIDRKRIARDLEEVTARGLYAEPPVDIEIWIEEDRVEVWTAGPFRRPVRLTPREALALTLGLRLLADGAGPDRAARLRALARRMDEGLAAIPAAELAERFAVDAGDPGSGGTLDVLREAARDRVRCRLTYLKPGSREPEIRVLHPYAIVHGGGRWYALGHSEEAEGAGTSVRAFRLDRVLGIEPLGERFETPDDFDVADHLTEGEVLRADETIEVTVRYSPRIARWIEEQGVDERLEDGGGVVRHTVADPEWLLRHVLAHGVEAEVVAPQEIRRTLRRRAEAMLGA